MARARRVYLCRVCGGTQSKWMGKCPDCGSWDALEAHTSEPSATRDPHRGAGAWGEGGEAGGGGASGGPVAAPVASMQGSEAATARLASGIGEFDRVLGGGLVPGSAVLVGGEPGIGKSTLLLQAAGALAAEGRRVLYVSSEESGEQVRLRAERLGVGHVEDLFVLADTNLARIAEQVRKVQPEAVIVDSIQMIYKGDLDASPGSVTQLRRCCSELVFLAKASGAAVVMVGHVTKEGTLAGPRLLEHLVDAVISFEGDRYHAHRLVRAVKNRFGTTAELGIFEMTGEGLREAPEGAGVAAVAGGDTQPRPGSVVCPVLQGSRCVLVELQALTATGFLGAAKRKSSGLDTNRLAMLIAVLEQHAGLRLADRDVFASSVGGLRVGEPAADLALLLAIAGAHYKRAVEPATAAVGEVGLGGEVRAVTQLAQRVREAGRLGYTRIITPPLPPGMARPEGVQVDPVRTVDEAIQRLG